MKEIDPLELADFEFTKSTILQTSGFKKSKR